MTPRDEGVFLCLATHVAGRLTLRSCSSGSHCGAAGAESLSEGTGMRLRTTTTCRIASRSFSARPQGCTWLLKRKSCSRNTPSPPTYSQLQPTSRLTPSIPTCNRVWSSFAASAKTLSTEHGHDVSRIRDLYSCRHLPSIVGAEKTSSFAHTPGTSTPDGYVRNCPGTAVHGLEARTARCGAGQAVRHEVGRVRTQPCGVAVWTVQIGLPCVSKDTSSVDASFVLDVAKKT